MKDKILVSTLEHLRYRFKDFLISERNLSENTVDAYDNDVVQFLDYLSTQSDIDFKTDYYYLEDIELYDDYIFSLYTKHYHSQSVIRKISSLSVFLKFLKDENIIFNSVSSLLNRPSSKRKIPVYLTVEEIDLLVKTFDLTKPTGIRDRALYELIYTCGLRVSEISGLKMSNVYFNENVIKVFGKGSKERFVPLGEKAYEYLNLYLLEARSKLLKKRKTNYVFINYKGEVLTRKGIWKNIKNAALKAGINKNVTVHTLRHSFATHLIQNGADIRYIQTLLGHESINTTEIYTHLDMSFLKNVYSKFHIHK